MEKTVGLMRPRRPLMAVLGPVFLMFIQTVGTFGAARGQPDRHAPDALAVFIALAGPVSLLFIRRYPVQVLAWITVITSVYLLREYPFGPVFISLAAAIVTTVICGRRLAAWVAVAALFALHFGLRGAFTDKGWSWGELAGVGAWALLILVFAEVIRSRRERGIAATQARDEAVKRQANEERLRIARELHDVVAHHMSLINVQAGVALHLLQQQPGQAETALTAIKAASKEALTELRTLVGVLREDGVAAPRSPTGRLASLDDLVERSSYAGLDVEKLVTGAEIPLPATVDLAAFRIVQEAITNVVRHAHAHRATIVLQYRERSLIVQVDDDGVGVPTTNAIPGNGIRGMTERATALGGSLDVTASPLGGTRVRAVLSLEPAQEET